MYMAILLPLLLYLQVVIRNKPQHASAAASGVDTDAPAFPTLQIGQKVRKRR